MTGKSYSVSQINGYIKNLISNDYLLGDINIKGEVSNCKYHSSGHIYFTLKDATGSIMAVMFRSNVYSGLSFKLTDGQLVIANGSINVYERDGRYQLYVKSVQLDGTGNLYEEYERLKQKLYEQGLFEFDIKKPIPRYPKKVGIVTAGTGAAIQDIMNIAKRRNPFVQLVLYPAKVQGDGAAEDIVNGIKVLDGMGLDTIIIGRGGGSIEDLWAFNEEIVAWAIYNAHTPIISGTGHEIDNTIADYVADLRAPTPSAACELAIPDVMTFIHQIDKLQQDITRHMYNKIDRLNSNLMAYEKQLRILNPKQRLLQKKQYIDELYDKLTRLMKQQYDSRMNKLMLLSSRINGMSPTAKLVNGFGYITKGEDAVLSANQVSVGDEINITLHDGIINATVGGTDVKQ